MDPFRTTTRRTVLKTGALLAGGAVITGTAGGHPKPQRTHDFHEGESVDVGDGEATAYATTNPAGRLSSLGVHVDGTALDTADTDEKSPHEGVDAHLDFTTDAVDTHQFTFMGFHFNPQGHAPPGIYDVPHFDFHFYMMDEEDVEDIEGGPATYSIPDAQIPEDYIRLPVLDTDDDDEADTPLVEEEMGEHLVDPTSPEFQGEDFTHTNIYGAYDPDDDGVGRLTFVEPMVTVRFLEGLDEEMEVALKTPDEYFTADDYPTTYVMKPDHSDGVYVSIDGFEEFPGPSE